VPIVVVSAKDALEFIPYGQVILEVADELRKPLFVCIDEGQLFSAARKRADGVGEACDIIAQFAERGAQARSGSLCDGFALYRHLASDDVRQQEPDPGWLPGRSNCMVGTGADVPFVRY